MEQKLKSIEAIAYEMAGREFCMSSPQEVSKVIYEEMKIPFPGTPVK
jgi:DNA polymerase I-like protein with 3'-5' exonuclease and polymerase domains